MKPEKLRQLLIDAYNEANVTEIRLREWHKAVSTICSEMLNDAHALKTLSVRIENILGALEDEAASVEAKTLVTEALRSPLC